MSYLFLNLTYTAAYFVNGLTFNLAYGEFTSAEKKNFTGRVKTDWFTPSLNLETRRLYESFKAIDNSSYKSYQPGIRTRVRRGGEPAPQLSSLNPPPLVFTSSTVWEARKSIEFLECQTMFLCSKSVSFGNNLGSAQSLFGQVWREDTVSLSASVTNNTIRG